MERVQWRTWPILGAVVVWGLRGADLSHSDLAVQRTLIGVRRDPSAFPGDLVADHAASHPGLWLDLLALLPDAPWVWGVCAGALAMATVVSSMALAHALGANLRGMGLAAGGLAVPLALPGLVDLVPAAPLSRSAALPLVLTAAVLAVRGRSAWAGVLAGLAVAIHPAVGGGGMLVVGAAGRRPWTTWLLACAVSVPIWGVGVEGLLDGATDPGWEAVVRARWGHHLEIGPLGGAVLAVGAMAWAVMRGWTATGPARSAARMAAGVLVGSAGVALAVRGGWLPFGLARLHPWHWGVAAAVWLWVDAATVGSARPRGWVLLGAMVAMSWTGDRPRWRGPPPAVPDEVHAELASVPMDRPLLIDPRLPPWPRLDTGRAVVVTVKDGAEVIADPRFAARWAARLRATCGLDALPQKDGPRWSLLRQACTPPLAADAWSVVAENTRAAAMLVKPRTVPAGWRVVATVGEWVWAVPPTPARSPAASRGTLPP